ncbi:MAG: cytochrome c [Bryobacteraceae bacterium]
MNLRILIGTSAFVMAFQAAAIGQSVEEYQPLMRAAAGANGKLQKTVGTDLAAAPALAADVKSAYKALEDFWAKHKVADAQEMSKKGQEAADEVATAAKAGNQQEAVAAAKKIGATCQGCHMAHRDKGADGKFIIK